MIVVRNTFIAKPGSASKLAKQIAEAAAAIGFPHFRVMTDLVGDFNTVVLEFEGENIQDFEARMNEYQTNPVFREKMAGYMDLYQTGRREIFTIVARS